MRIICVYVNIATQAFEQLECGPCTAAYSTCVLHGRCEGAEDGADLSKVHLLQADSQRSCGSALKSSGGGGRQGAGGSADLRDFGGCGGSLRSRVCFSCFGSSSSSDGGRTFVFLLICSAKKLLDLSA